MFKWLMIALGVVPLFGGTHVVTTTNDSGAGSLRQAIIDANDDETTPRVINFSIGSNVQTIRPLSPLPIIVASDIFIDGTTQPGYSVGDPQIVIDASLVDPFTINGLVIDGAESCTLQGLVINNGFSRAILIRHGAEDVVVQDCFIGTDQTGTAAAPNLIGVLIITQVHESNNNITIGTLGHGNLISGNQLAGILISGNGDSRSIQSNNIGTDITGMSAIPNMYGIVLNTLSGGLDVLLSNIVIGGIDTDEGNIISGNDRVGIIAIFQPISYFTIQNNYVGVNADLSSLLPNGIDNWMIQIEFFGMPLITHLTVVDNVTNV